jgi:hypothetical protein
MAWSWEEKAEFKARERFEFCRLLGSGDVVKGLHRLTLAERRAARLLEMQPLAAKSSSVANGKEQQPKRTRARKKQPGTDAQSSEKPAADEAGPEPAVTSVTQREQQHGPIHDHARAAAAVAAPPAATPPRVERGVALRADASAFVPMPSVEPATASSVRKGRERTASAPTPAADVKASVIVRSANDQGAGWTEVVKRRRPKSPPQPSAPSERRLSSRASCAIVPADEHTSPAKKGRSTHGCSASAVTEHMDVLVEPKIGSITARALQIGSITARALRMKYAT